MLARERLETIVGSHLLVAPPAAAAGPLAVASEKRVQAEGVHDCIGRRAHGAEDQVDDVGDDLPDAALGAADDAQQVVVAVVAADDAGGRNCSISFRMESRIVIFPSLSEQLSDSGPFATADADELEDSSDVPLTTVE